MQQSPAYRQHLASCQEAAIDPSPHTHDDTWATAALSIEELEYVGIDLADILGNMALLNDQEAQDAPLAQLVAAPTTSPTLTTPPQNVPPLSPSPASPVVHIEEALAHRVLAQAHPTLPPWVESSSPQDRGYNPKPKKGKPLPKAPLKR